MNPRDFCIEGNYPLVILTCFNFDPLFFERYAWPALRAGGAQQILVLADGAAVAEAAPRWAGQAALLGRRYQLSTPTADGAFHPKLMLRLGAADGRVWVGSGNMTASGWGLNTEVASAWHFGPGHQDNGAWVAFVLTNMLRWSADDAMAAESIKRALALSWLPPAANDGPALLQGPGLESLATQVARRWSGRSFSKLRGMTGSTDAAGAMLRWAAEAFGVREAVLALDPAWASFEPAAVAKLPLSLQLESASGTHAKFFWFDGGEQPGGIIGSANCSAAAWRGVNTECVVVYDDADPDAFVDLLDKIGEGGPPGDVLAISTTNDDQESDSARPVFSIMGARVEATANRMVIQVSPPPDPSANVTLHVLDVVVPMVGDGRPGDYVCDIPAALATQSQTVFCAVQVKDGTGSFMSPPRWLDDVALLARSTTQQSISSALKDLLNAPDASAQRQVIRDVQLITDALFDPAATFVDPPASVGKKGDKHDEDDESDGPALNPSDMVVALDELIAPDDAGPSSGAGHWTLPLVGVMAALFGDGTGDDDDDDAPDFGETDLKDGAADKKPTKNKKKGRRSKVPANTRAELARQVDRFFEKLHEKGDSGDLRVVESFEATRFVQALSYPLSIVAIGAGAGWVDEDRGRRWVTRVVDLLFHQRGPGSSVEDAGVLSRALSRFRKQAKEDVFLSVVGDGSIWLPLCTALAALSRDEMGPVERMHDLMAWRALWTSRMLLDGTPPQRLRFLLRRLRVPHAREKLAANGPQSHRAVQALEAWVARHGQDAVAAQRGRHLPHKVGDPLWGPKARWAVVTELPDGKGRIRAHIYRAMRARTVAPGGVYANLRLAAKSDPALAELLSLAGAVQ